MAIAHKGILHFMLESNDKRKAAYYTVRGIKRPVNRKAKTPLTEKQLAQRMKFALANRFIKTILPIIQLGFGAVKKRVMSANNVAVQGLLKEAITGEYPNFKIDFPNVEISRGKLERGACLELIHIGSDLVEIVWSQHRFYKYTLVAFGDRINILFYDEQRGQALFKFEAANREDCKVQVRLPRGTDVSALHCWVFFSTEDKKVASDSQYLGHPVSGIIK